LGKRRLWSDVSRAVGEDGVAGVDGVAGLGVIAGSDGVFESDSTDEAGVELSLEELTTAGDEGLGVV
jgi:hypothetical protein